MPLINKDLADLFLFADDAKLSKMIKIKDDKALLQKALNEVVDWSNIWLLSLNIIKCMVLCIRRNNESINEYFIHNNGVASKLENFNHIKDLGVIIDNRLNFNKHINDKIKKANSMLGIIKRNFKYMDNFTFLTLNKSLVRSHLEYAGSIWSPYKKGLIESIEKVQRRATKIMPNLKYLPYEDRLKALKLPTLIYRRFREDMLETYKILHNIYDKSVMPTLILNKFNSTRGNNLKLEIQGSKHDSRKNSFCVRIPHIWNNLPNYVVNSKDVNQFKINIDNHWSKYDILYNYKAQPPRTRL